MKKIIAVLLCMCLLMSGAGMLAAATNSELNAEAFESKPVNISDSENLLLNNGFSAEDIVILGTDVEVVATLIRTNSFTDEGNYGI